jgi:hypothetical protein
MTKREREIGRASKKEHIGGDIWESLPEDVQQYWCNLGLAAVSRAREIDTCETFEHAKDIEDNSRGDKECDLFQIMTYQINGCGCNRHQPKEA